MVAHLRISGEPNGSVLFAMPILQIAGLGRSPYNRPWLEETFVAQEGAPVPITRDLPNPASSFDNMS